MVKDQRYDICEMAIGAFFQAHDAGKPLVALPVALVGGFHHRSLYRAPGATALSGPGELTGHRVGVRSYSQTTGLWVRGWMAEEYGIGLRDVTWVVTERSHLAEFEDPPFVEMSDEPVADAIRSGSVAAGILGLSDSTDLPSMLPDHRARSRAWYDRHGFTPINHILVATKTMVEERPDVIRSVCADLAAGIAEVASGPSEPGEDGIMLPPAPRAGVEAVLPCLGLAAGYAYEQGLIQRPVDASSLFEFDPLS